MIGRDTDGFEEIVVEIIRRHVPELRDDDVSTRPSSRARYLAVSVTFTATSQEQLDALYGELGAHEHVLMLL